MKKLLAILLILAMALSLAACGESAAPDPNEGVYDCTSVEAYGLTMDPGQVFGDDFSIELKGGGKAVLHFDGKKQNMKWTLNGTAFRAESGGEVLEGTLENGVLTVPDVFGTGMSAVFVNSAYTPPTAPPAEPAAGPAAEPAAEPAAAPAEEPMTPERWWSGKWYGWAVYKDAGGGFARNAGITWDVCATITLDGHDGEIALYSPNQTAEEATDRVTLLLLDGPTEMGRMISMGGSFGLDTVEEGEWYIEPDNSAVSCFDHMICIYGQYDADANSNWYTYNVFLRPWGMDWSDVAAADTSDMPYESMLPKFYEDWYLPQLENPVTPSQPAQPESPAQPAQPEPQTQSLAPGEPSSAGSGVIGMEKLLRLYKWMDTLSGGALFTKTYEEIAAVAGADGEDCGNTGPNSVSAQGDHYFNWYADDVHFIHVGFRPGKDGTWTVCGFNTSNVTRADYEDVDISDLAPRAGDGPTQNVEFTLKDFFEHFSCTVKAALPAQNWYGQYRSYTVYFYNESSEDRINSASARIELELKDNEEGFDFYKDKFSNLKELPGRSIGGIEMKGRSYSYVGMDWIEYIGTAPSGCAVSVRISGVAVTDGSEGAAILDSIRFTW